jgi:hypothetical protein
MINCVDFDESKPILPFPLRKIFLIGYFKAKPALYLNYLTEKMRKVYRLLFFAKTG